MIQSMLLVTVDYSMVISNLYRLADPGLGVAAGTILYINIIAFYYFHTYARCMDL